MKYLNIFLVIIFCMSLNFGASVANGADRDILNIPISCYAALKNRGRKESIERSVQLAFEKTRAHYNNREFTAEPGETDLIQVAKHGNINNVNFVLEHARKHTLTLYGLNETGAQLVFTVYVNEVDSNGMTALMYAAENGHKAAVITLVRVLISLDTQDNNSMTASAHAAANDHHDIAEMLANDSRELLRELGGTSYGF